MCCRGRITDPAPRDRRLGRNDEQQRAKAGPAPARPLLVFEQSGNRFTVIGRNDNVVFKADDGGQCDPFLDGSTSIAVKGRYFTVQNDVASGHHWTDYITFWLDDHTADFVFDNERAEAWALDPSNNPDAEALMRDGKQNSSVTTWSPNAVLDLAAPSLIRPK
jgi:hypothetical protein